MIVKTHWWGAEFIPENINDRELIKRMMTWEITENYGAGEWSMDEETLVLER